MELPASSQVVRLLGQRRLQWIIDETMQHAKPRWKLDSLATYRKRTASHHVSRMRAAVKNAEPSGAHLDGKGGLKMQHPLDEMRHTVIFYPFHEWLSLLAGSRGEDAAEPITSPPLR